MFIYVVHHYRPPETIEEEFLPKDIEFKKWLESAKKFPFSHSIFLEAHIEKSILRQCIYSDEQSRFSTYPQWVKAIELQKLAFRMLLISRVDKSEGLPKARWNVLRNVVNPPKLSGEDKQYPLKALNPEFWPERYFGGQNKFAFWVTNRDSYNAVYFYDDQELHEPDENNVPYDGILGCHKVDIPSSGLIVGPYGPITTEVNRKLSGRGFSIPLGECLFVLNKEEELIISQPWNINDVTYLHHSSLTKGEPVICAGSLRIRQGELLEITIDSGHYTPNEECLLNFIKFLEKKNVSLEQTRITLDHNRNLKRTFMSVQEFKEQMAAKSLQTTIAPKIGSSV